MNTEAQPLVRQELVYVTVKTDKGKWRIQQRLQEIAPEGHRARRCIEIPLKAFKDYQLWMVVIDKWDLYRQEWPNVLIVKASIREENGIYERLNLYDLTDDEIKEVQEYLTTKFEEVLRQDDKPLYKYMEFSVEPIEWVR